MFTTKGVSESGGKYIGYGLKDVKITNIEAKEAEGNIKPSVFINFQELGTEKTLQVRFPFSENAKSYSLRKIKHLATKLVTEEEIDKINVQTVTEYAGELNRLLANKDIRVMFEAEEINGQINGKNNWLKSVIGFPPFAEPIGTTPSGLKFDPNKHIKRLPAMATAPTGANTGQGNDLPF